jgi:two-component system, sensor histidine kinase and response regulator
MPETEKPCVLVVDDEQIVCLSCQEILKNSGYDVEVRTDPREGFGLAVKREYTAILLDLAMPGLDGVEFLDRIRKQGVRSPVIIITGYGTLENAVRTTKLGAYDFLPKPFTPDELTSVVQKAAAHLEMLRRAQRLEEEKRQLRFNFLSVLAHELKAPLNAIEGYMGILKNQVEGDELGMVNRCSERLGGMRKLISDLLDLTRIESGQRKQEFATFDLASLVDKAVEAVKPSADARGILVTCEGRRPFPVTADPTDMEMILNNLVSNAVKYNTDGGKVTIRLSRKDPDVVLDVEDTGIGLTKEDAAKLFTEFTRIRNAQTARIVGSGLGLSIVQKLARLYQGDVTVRSEYGKGSTFTVKIRDTVSPGKES